MVLSKVAVLAGFLVTLASIGASPSKAQAAETFSVDSSNGGMALNTNNQFRKIDGQPRMSLWQRQDQDPDQQFDRQPGSRGGILLKHRSTSSPTSKCINAYRRYNGAEINVWNCNANDADQNFTLVDLGGGYNLIQLTSTNFCLDSPTRDDYGKVHLWTCDLNNPNQRWKSSAYIAPSANNIILKPTTTNLNFSRNQQWITPSNYRFVFQGDGNLVLYSPQGRAIWATGTGGTGASLFSVQVDGNIVLYENNKVLWATNTSGNPGSSFAIQGDGNVVVYNQAGQPIFATQTDGGRTGSLSAAADWRNPPLPPLPPITFSWRLPWRAGQTARITQNWHNDGYGNTSALDIGLPAGTPVVAPIDSTVISQCHAGNHHRAISLRGSDGQRYTLIHVTTANISVGKTYRRGEQIGVVAGDKPNNDCAWSTGPHLHFGLPSRTFSIGGYNFSPNSIPTPITARD